MIEKAIKKAAARSPIIEAALFQLSPEELPERKDNRELRDGGSVGV
jgi:hypothetical protein